MAAVSLSPYDPAATCSKCGHDDIRTIFRQGCLPPSCMDHPDVMLRICRRCSYRWDEAPLTSGGGEQRYKPAWDVKPIGRHGSRVQRRRARCRR